MLELPAWDRARLETALPADVEAARWYVYARKLEPTVTEPFADRLEVAIIDAIEQPKRRASAAKLFESRRREKLVQATKAQADVRRALLLDAEDLA